MKLKPIQTIDLELPTFEIHKVPSFSNPFKFLFFHIQQHYYHWHEIIGVKISQRQIRAGKGKILRSLADLD